MAGVTEVQEALRKDLEQRAERHLTDAKRFELEELEDPVELLSDVRPSVDFPPKS